MCIVHSCILPLLTMSRSPPREARRKHGPAEFLQLCRCRLGFTHIINPRLQVSLVVWIMIVEYHCNWSPISIIFKITCEQYRHGFRYYGYRSLLSDQCNWKCYLKLRWNISSIGYKASWLVLCYSMFSWNSPIYDKDRIDILFQIFNTLGFHDILLIYFLLGILDFPSDKLR